MSEARIARNCKQCGELKPIEHFRKYYGNRKGHYTICLQCEKINARHKYLSAKQVRNTAEQEELNKIEMLYTVQRNIGLQPPRSQSGRSVPVTANLDDMIKRYGDTPSMAAAVGTYVPHDLQEWLTKELTEEPDYYMDVYDKLKKQFRPQLRIDQVTLLPVYDDTYKAVLDTILERFNGYEDEYYNK